MDKYNSRKLVFCGIAFIVFTGLLLSGKLGAAEYADMAVYTLGIYVVGNFSEHYAKRGGDK